MAKKKVRKKKNFELTWVFEKFEDHDTFMTKRMFGGLAAYCHGKMVMMIAEDPGKRDYKGKTFSFDIWNGILFPTDYCFQIEIQEKYPQLFQHPILKKWLYLPQETEGFDALAETLSEEIRRNNKLFGIFPKVD